MDLPVKRTIFAVLAIISSAPIAACPIEEAEKLYRSYNFNVSNVRSFDDIGTGDIYSERSRKIFQDSIQLLLREGHSNEEKKKTPLLNAPMEIRKKAFTALYKASRDTVPADAVAEISGTDDDLTLRYAWRSTKEEVNGQDKIPVTAITEHKAEITLVCEGGWKIHSERYEQSHEVYAKDGSRISNSNLGRKVTWSFPAE